jgi:hypothetical protein
MSVTQVSRPRLNQGRNDNNMNVPRSRTYVPITGHGLKTFARVPAQRELAVMIAPSISLVNGVAVDRHRPTQHSALMRVRRAQKRVRNVQRREGVDDEGELVRV